MPPNKRKVAAACKAMKRFGIPEDEVKPVLNELLELYNNKWTLIEEDRYKVLLDVLLEKKREEDKGVNSEQNDEPEVVELPTKRLRSRHQKEHTSARVANSRSQPKRASVRRRAHQDETTEFQTCSEPEDSEPLVKRFSPRRQEGLALVPVEISFVDIFNSPPVTTPSTRAYLDKPELSSSSQSCSVPGDSERRKRQKWPEDETSQPHHCFKRAKSSSLSFQEKEKTSVTPQVALNSGGTGIEPLAVLKVGPYMDHTPVENVLEMYHNNSLDLPRDEPFTDDQLHNEVPLAMILPALPCVSSFSNGKSTDVEEDGFKFLEPESLDEEDKGDCVSEVSQFDIASSPKGEVKIFLTCNSSGRSDFQVPNLDAFLKMVEGRILKSYRITEPNFSLLKLMTEFCDFFWALSTESAVDEHLRSINLPAQKISDAEEIHDDKDGYGGNYCIASSLSSGLVKISDAQEIHDDKYGYEGNYCIPSCLSSGLVRFQNLFEVIPQIPKPIALSGLGGFHCIAGFNIKYIEKLKVIKDPRSSNSCNVEPVRKRHCPFPFLKYSGYVDDITGGEEKVKISLLNGRSPEDLPTFKYISHNLVHDKAYVNFSLAHISDEDCCSHCFGDCLSSPIPCACARETGGEFAYMSGGLVKEKFLKECISMNLDADFYCQKCPLERSKNKESDKCKGHLLRRFIKECWFKCRCSKKCGNRVVQHGISASLQVFLTPEGKGWGLRTLEELPRGAFVCEYVGEIITSLELHERNLQSSGNENHTFSVPLDANWGTKHHLKDEEALYLDATAYGNVARFINHRCHDATLVAIPVEVETPNRHYYHLAFFTRMKVEAMEELTWDYGINFDDHDHDHHPVKPFECLCGSQFCRGLNH